MNEEIDRSDQNAADLWVSEWLDGGKRSDSQLPASFDKNRAADLLWLHALLEHEYRRDRVAQSVRIDRAMTTIRSVVAEQTRPVLAKATNRRRSVSKLASVLAIALVVCTGLWLQTSTPQRSAHAAISQIQQAASQIKDREYLVTLTFAALPENKVPSPDRSIQAMLFVRGGEAFAVKAPSMLRTGSVWFGRDRQEAWFKPVSGPTLSGSHALSLQQRFYSSWNEGPFLQITTVIDRLEDHYDLTLLSTEVPARGTLPPVPACQHIRGTRRVSELAPTWLPDVVDIHADPHSGTIMRLVLNWNEDVASTLKEIQFDFLQQSQKPDDWYRSSTVRESQ